MTAISVQQTRRDVLYIATAAMAAAGAAAVTWPLVSQMNPAASTLATGAPLDVDLALIAVGQVIKVVWRGLPYFISHRTAKQIEEARVADWRSFRDPQPDSDRVKAGHEQWLIVSAICTHLGCIPTEHEGDYDGWFCHCHGSQYDSSGRARLGPAPLNLPLPAYQFLSDTKVRIGEA